MDKASKIFTVGTVPLENTYSFPIGTDAFLLALLPTYSFNQNSRVLDLCAGSGVVGVSLQQRYGIVHISALEYIQEAVSECQKNYSAAGLDKHAVIAGSFEDSACFKEGEFSHILVNPPYYLEAVPAEKWQVAKHIQFDTIIRLLESVYKWLSSSGVCSMILPAQHLGVFMREAVRAGLFCSEIRAVSAFEQQETTRYIVFLTKQANCQVKKHPKFAVMADKSSFTIDYKQITQNILWLTP